MDLLLHTQRPGAAATLPDDSAQPSAKPFEQPGVYGRSECVTTITTVDNNNGGVSAMLETATKPQAVDAMSYNPEWGSYPQVGVYEALRLQ